MSDNHKYKWIGKRSEIIVDVSYKKKFKSKNYLLKVLMKFWRSALIDFKSFKMYVWHQEKN